MSDLFCAANVARLGENHSSSGYRRKAGNISHDLSQGTGCRQRDAEGNHPQLLAAEGYLRLSRNKLARFGEISLPRICPESFEIVLRIDEHGRLSM